MKPWLRSLGVGVLFVPLSAVSLFAAVGSRVWTFEDETPGKAPRGFRAVEGTWEVVSLDGQGKAVEQRASNPDKVFNVLLAEGTKIKNLDLSVRLKAIAGVEDQGGGLVWRARDGKNYYIARFNPLEDNFRVYKVVDGVRTQFQNADVKNTPGWHELRVLMNGDHITCSLDGKALLDVHDSTFTDAGMVGLWSKSDARSQFDDLTVNEN